MKIIKENLLFLLSIIVVIIALVIIRNDESTQVLLAKPLIELTAREAVGLFVIVAMVFKFLR